MTTATHTLASDVEPVAYQKLVNGKWTECSLFVAQGWGEMPTDGSIRALFTDAILSHQTQTCAWAAKARVIMADALSHLEDDLGRLHPMCEALRASIATVPAGVWAYEAFLQGASK